MDKVPIDKSDMRNTRQYPRSGILSRLVLVVSIFLPIALPGAFYLHTKARREADSNPNLFWSRSWLNNPFLLFVFAWVVICLILFVWLVISGLEGQNIA